MSPATTRAMTPFVCRAPPAGMDARMKILIAVDENEASHDALEFAKEVIPHDADVLLLNVAQYAIAPVGGLGAFEYRWYPQAETWREDLAEEVDEAAERTVQRARAELGAEDAEERIVHGDAGPKICEVAEEEKVDLVVLGARHQGRWSRLWFGSVSDHVVHNAPCPVLVVR